MLPDPARSTGATVNDDAGQTRRRRDLAGWGPIVAFLLLGVVFSLLRPDTFLTTGSLLSLLNNQAVLAIVACGLTVVLIAGQFDLSIGFALTFAGALSASLVTAGQVPVWAALVIVLGCGALIGVANGVLVTYFGIPALVATLAVGTLLEGLTLFITNGETIFRGLEGYIPIGRWAIGGIQAPTFYLLLIATGLWAFLRYMPAGRFIHAVGASSTAARVAGIRVDRYVVLAFVIAGVLAAFAGIVQTARNGSATPTAGATFLLPAFAAAFLGSVTLRRGEFHILGTVIGVYLIATGSLGFVLLGAPFYTQQLFSGFVLIVATAGSRFLRRHS
jgi:ribose transport system permease protein